MLLNIDYHKQNPTPHMPKTSAHYLQLWNETQKRLATRAQSINSMLGEVVKSDAEEALHAQFMARDKDSRTPLSTQNNVHTVIIAPTPVAANHERNVMNGALMTGHVSSSQPDKAQTRQQSASSRDSTMSSDQRHASASSDLSPAPTSSITGFRLRKGREKSAEVEIASFKASPVHSHLRPIKAVPKSNKRSIDHSPRPIPFRSSLPPLEHSHQSEQVPPVTIRKDRWMSAGYTLFDLLEDVEGQLGQSLSEDFFQPRQGMSEAGRMYLQRLREALAEEKVMEEEVSGCEERDLSEIAKDHDENTERLDGREVRIDAKTNGTAFVEHAQNQKLVQSQAVDRSLSQSATRERPAKQDRESQPAVSHADGVEGRSNCDHSQQSVEASRRSGEPDGDLSSKRLKVEERKSTELVHDAESTQATSDSTPDRKMHAHAQQAVKKLQACRGKSIKGQTRTVTAQQVSSPTDLSLAWPKFGRQILIRVLRDPQWQDYDSWNLDCPIAFAKKLFLWKLQQRIETHKAVIDFKLPKPFLQSAQAILSDTDPGPTWLREQIDLYSN